MVEPRSAILQGTLDLMVLKTLEQMGPLHGYGIARRIEQVGEQAVIVNQGTIYLCLLRLLQKRWISAKWGTSENNRKAKFYAITKAGQAQLKAETENWERISGVISRVLQPEATCPPKPRRRWKADACARFSIRPSPGSATSFVLAPAMPISTRSWKCIWRWWRRTRSAAA